MDLSKLNNALKAPYPDTTGVKKNVRYANLLLSDYAGLKSEDTAIHQYTYQAFLLHDYEEEICHILKKLAMNEMHHLEELGITICRLGGTPMYINSRGQYFSGGYANYTTNLIKMLNSNIEAERQAIMAYTMRIHQIDCPKVQALLARIIEDEKIHIEVLEEIKSWVTMRSKTNLV